MKIAKPLLASLAILSLAVPVTGGALIAFSATPALAKGGNGKGGSDRGSRSDRGHSGKSDRDRGRKPAGGQGGLGKGQGAGQGKGAATAPGQAKPAKAAAPASEAIDGDGELPLHPRDLGSMNGAMNANINAVLAHIRNGNTNGPVGALAGLAVAEHNATGAEEVLESAEAFEALDDALEEAGFDSLEEYETAVADGETEAIATIDEAIEALGEDAGGEGPSADEIGEAEDALEALEDAEDRIMDAWNKSDAATDEEKTALLDALRDRLDAESEAIAEAIDASGTDEAEDDETGAGEASEEEAADDAGEALDPDTQAMLDTLKF